MLASKYISGEQNLVDALPADDPVRILLAVLRVGAEFRNGELVEGTEEKDAA